MKNKGSIAGSSRLPTFCVLLCVTLCVTLCVLLLAGCGASEEASIESTESGENPESAVSTPESSGLSEIPIGESSESGESAEESRSGGGLSFTVMPGLTVRLPEDWVGVDDQTKLFCAESADGAVLSITRSEAFEDSLKGLTEKLLVEEMKTRLDEELRAKGTVMAMSAVSVTMAGEKHTALSIDAGDRVFLQLYLPTGSDCIVITASAASGDAAEAVLGFFSA